MAGWPQADPPTLSSPGDPEVPRVSVCSLRLACVCGPRTPGAWATGFRVKPCDPAQRVPLPCSARSGPPGGSSFSSRHSSLQQTLIIHEAASSRRVIINLCRDLNRFQHKQLHCTQLISAAAGSRNSPCRLPPPARPPGARRTGRPLPSQASLYGSQLPRL